MHSSSQKSQILDKEEKDLKKYARSFFSIKSSIKWGYLDLGSFFGS
jgi:hypothetical protein